MNYSRIIEEASMGMMNPSKMVSRLDLVVLELAAAGIIFRRLLEGFRDFRVFMELRGSGIGHRGGQHTLGRTWHLWRGLVGVAHLGLRLWYFF